MSVEIKRSKKDISAVFTRVKNKLALVLADSSQIHHVGSTAVLGLDGKNILDILISAKDSEFDKVIGLELGADDYVTKPFSNRELQARVKALLRRTDLVSVDNQESDEKKTQPLQIGDLEIVPDAYVAKKYGEELDLTHREFELLYHLASHIGQVITREHLLETVWGYDYFGDARTIDTHVKKLRAKLESRGDYIKTVWGMGYKFEVE